MWALAFCFSVSTPFVDVPLILPPSFSFLTFKGLEPFSFTWVFQLFSAFDLYLCVLLLSLPIEFLLGGLVLDPGAGGAGHDHFLISSLHRQGHAV